jgi:hypothetical protein
MGRQYDQQSLFARQPLLYPPVLLFGNQTGIAIDCNKYDGVAEIIQEKGGQTGDALTFSLEEAAASGGPWTTVPAADIIGIGANAGSVGLMPGVAGVPFIARFRLDLKDRKRWLRAKAVWANPGVAYALASVTLIAPVRERPAPLGLGDAR